MLVFFIRIFRLRKIKECPAGLEPPVGTRNKCENTYENRWCNINHNFQITIKNIFYDKISK